MPVHYSRMMSSENAPKKIVQALINFVNMAKWLMDENQQPSVTQQLGRLFPSIRVSFLGLMLVNHLLQQLIQITLVLQHGLPQNRRMKRYWDQKQHQRNNGSLCRIKQPQEKLPRNLLFFRCKTQRFQICYLVHVISQFWSSTTAVSGLNK